MANFARIENVFPAEMIDSISKYLHNASWEYGHASNPKIPFPHWSKPLCRDDEWSNGLDISHTLEEPFKSAWEYLKEKHFPNRRLLRCYSNAHTHGIDGYPHVDSYRKDAKTIVIYVNKIWDIDWGGETIVYEKDMTAYVAAPVYNTAAVFKSNRLHKGTAPSRNCPKLRITLMFKVAPENDDPIRDDHQRYLHEIGANKIVTEFNDVLTKNLLTNYDRLYKAKMSKDVCLAGASYLLFGEKLWHKVTKELLVSRIGENATNLADMLYQQFSYDNKLNTAIFLPSPASATEEQKMDLTYMKAAILSSCDTLKYIPQLEQLWNMKNSDSS